MNMNKTNVSIGRNRQNYDCRARKSIKITTFQRTTKHTHTDINTPAPIHTYEQIAFNECKHRDRESKRMNELVDVAVTLKNTWHSQKLYFACTIPHATY